MIDEYNKNLFFKNLENVINSHEYTFRIYLNNIYPEKISRLILNNIKINNINKTISDISIVKFIDNKIIQIKPYNIKHLNILYKNILENNILELNILKYKDYIEINIPIITKEKRFKIINIINKELEKIKINIRNDRRIFNNKILYFFKKKKITIDQKKKILETIDSYINKKIKIIENISKIKKDSLLNI